MKGIPGFRGPIGKGVGIGTLFAWIAIFILSLITQFSDLSETVLTRGVYLINMVAALIGAIIAARQAGRKGWYYGSLTSVLFACLMMFVGLLMGHAVFNSTTLLQLLIISALGAFGGMIGVSTSRGNR